MTCSTPGESHTHAVMFHHFHNEHHPVGQGSLSASQFEDMLDWLGDRYSLLTAGEYLYKMKRQILSGRDICLTFDDALLCQSDIAAPILNKRNLQAYFFVYSSPFMGDPDYLEIYRYFRTTEFETIDAFYEAFFRKVEAIFTTDYEASKIVYDGREYLKAYPFYTESDKWFRYLRDMTLGKERYEEVMMLLMRERLFDPKAVMQKLWMNESSLRDLTSNGHTVGLHSYSHPTTLHMLSKEVQEDEYRRNYKHLSELLEMPLFSMSHPCGNYNLDTLGILNAQGVGIGFRSNNDVKVIKSSLEIPREDHANILKEMAE